MSEELKPCPFCGGDAFLHESDEFWYVSCNHCINQTTHFYNGKDIVIDRWNTRVDDAKLKLAVEALEQLADICINCGFMRSDHDENGEVDYMDERGMMLCGKPVYPASDVLAKIGEPAKGRDV